MKEEEGKAEFWNWRKIEYISLEMCLLTHSDIEVQLTIQLNAVLDELNILWSNKHDTFIFHFLSVARDSKDKVIKNPSDVCFFWWNESVLGLERECSNEQDLFILDEYNDIRINAVPLLYARIF